MNDKAAQVVPAVVALPAEIDVTNADQVYEQLLAALVPGVSALIADMTGTQFWDSSCVHAIMHAHESASARDVQMRLAFSPHTSVRRVLQLIGVGRVTPVHESLKEALDGA